MQSPKSKTMNQTPLGKRERAAAAKSAMGGQYITRVKKTQPTGAKINVKPRQQRRMKKYRSSMERLMEQRTLESDEFKKFVQEKLGVDEDTDKKTPKPRQQKKPKDKKFLSLDEYIDKARDAGFTDARIKDFLVNVTKRFSAREVNKALASSVPASFGNMTGGVNAAKKLIKKIKTFQTKLTKKKRTTNQPTA